MKRSEALAFRHKVESAAEMQTDEQAVESIDIFPAWQSYMDAMANKRYRYGNKLYRCIQPHRTQPDWTPDVTPALFVEVSIEDWPVSLKNRANNGAHSRPLLAQG